MQVIYMIANVLLLIVSVGLIVLVLAQQGKQAGLSGAIAGGAEAFLGKKKATSLEGLLERLTKIAAVLFIVLAVTMSLLQRFMV